MPVSRSTRAASAKSENPNNNIRPTSLQSYTEPGGERKVVGNYMLGKTIGEGTFGKVRLGVHIPTGEKVAVKVLEKSRIKEQADVRRVNREIKILKKNRHENIIQLYEVYDTTNSIYLIMENAEGGEMFDFIVAQRRVPELLACNFFHQITDGVEVLHRNEITHRDLKPENLLLKASGGGWIVKIVDFGLSNTHEGGKFLSTACGSPCYAAPEMVAGKKYFGPLADLWSMGVILFALVCGYLPFEDNNTSVLYKKILAGNYSAPNWISVEVKHLIRKILEVDPKKRYTVADIRTHPWYKVVSQEDIPRETITTTDNQAIMSDVMAMVKSEGLDLKVLEDGLSSNACNAATATYYLIVKKCRLRHQKQLRQQGASSDRDQKLPAIQGVGAAEAPSAKAAQFPSKAAAQSVVAQIVPNSGDATALSAKAVQVPSSKPTTQPVASATQAGAIVATSVDGARPTVFLSAKNGAAQPLPFQPAQPTQAPPSFRRPTGTLAPPSTAVNMSPFAVPTPAPSTAAAAVAASQIKAPFVSPNQSKALPSSSKTATDAACVQPILKIPALKIEAASGAAGVKKPSSIVTDNQPPESPIQRLYRERHGSRGSEVDTGPNSSALEKAPVGTLLISQTSRQPSSNDSVSLSEQPKTARAALQSIPEKDSSVQPFEPLPASGSEVVKDKEDEMFAAQSTSSAVVDNQITKSNNLNLAPVAAAPTPRAPAEAPRDAVGNVKKGRNITSLQP